MQRHVRQPRTKRRKVKEGRKKGYIQETKGIPIRKEKRLGTKEGTNGELVPRKPARFTHLQAPLIGTASHSLAPHGAHTPSSDSGSQAFQMRVCHVITPATLAIPEGIPLTPAPQGVTKDALTTVCAQKHLSDAKTVSQPVLLKFQSVVCKGPHGHYLLGGRLGSGITRDKCPQCGQA